MQRIAVSGKHYCHNGFLMIVSVMLFMLIVPKFCSAQNQDTLYDNVVEDPVLDTSQVKHSPKMAGWMSAALPGLGQIYNKKYWKPPVIYVLFGTLTYFVIDNNKKYQDYRQAYIMRTDDDPTNDDIYPYYTTDNLRVLKDKYWKKRDFNIILMALVYALNVLDAVVDAHFFTYDMSDDLSLHLDPVMRPAFGLGGGGTMTGLSLSLTF